MKNTKINKTMRVINQQEESIRKRNTNSTQSVPVTKGGGDTIPIIKEK